MLDKLFSTFCNEFSISPEATKKWLQEISNAYSNRVCYDLKYLNSKLEHFEAYKGKLEKVQPLLIALIFQSIVYDTKSSENVDQCIKKFNDFANEGKLTKEFVESVERFIYLSISTDEKNCEDDNYFLDINFVHLAADWNEYTEFSDKTRIEYSFMNDKDYHNLRLKVLESFLQIPTIFLTEEFRNQFEEKARSNLTKEIADIKKKMGM